MSFYKIFAVVLTPFLFLSACSSSDEDASNVELIDGEEEPETDSDSTRPAKSDEDESEKESTSESITVKEKQNSGPGEPFDIGPADGDKMAVVGVAFDDKLNFRSGPDPSDSIVGSAAPLDFSIDIVSQGEGLLFTKNAWWKTKIDGKDSYANFAFLGALGDELGMSSDIENALEDNNTQSSIDDLIAAITLIRGDEDTKSVVIKKASNITDTKGTVMFDMIGLKDDAVKGERLEITYAVNEDRDEFTFETAVVQSICSRGVTAGKCL